VYLPLESHSDLSNYSASVLSQVGTHITFVVGIKYIDVVETSFQKLNTYDSEIVTPKQFDVDQ